MCVFLLLSLILFKYYWVYKYPPHLPMSKDRSTKMFLSLYTTFWGKVDLHCVLNLEVKIMGYRKEHMAT